MRLEEDLGQEVLKLFTCIIGMCVVDGYLVRKADNRLHGHAYLPAVEFARRLSKLLLRNPFIVAEENEQRTLRGGTGYCGGI